MSPTSRVTNYRRTVIKRMKRGKTGGERRNLFTRQNRMYWLMAVFFTFYIAFILYVDFTRFIFRENWPASRTYIARVGFSCEDIRRTDRDRETRAGLVPPVYEREDGWLKRILAPLERFVDLIRTDNKMFDASRKEWEMQFDGDFPAALVNAVRFDQKTYDAVRTELIRNLEDIAQTGVIDLEDIDDAKGGFIVIAPREAEDKTPVRRLFTPRSALDELGVRLKAAFDGVTAEALTTLLAKGIEASIVKSDALTADYREKARQEVPMRHQEIQKGTVIVNEGELITRAVAVELEAEQKSYKRILNPIDKVRMYFGNVLFTAVFIVIIGLYMSFFGGNITLSEGKLFIYFLLVMLFLVVAKLLSFIGMPANAVPIIFVGMISAIIVDLQFAIMIVFMLALFTGNIFKADIFHAIALFASGGIGVFFCRHIRRRIQILKGGVIAGLVNAAIVYGVGFARNNSFDSVMIAGLAGLVNGVVSGIVLIGVLPLIEYIFDTTTDVRLLELSDQGHPLLRNLFLQASGTYTHSLSVGNLAESAAGAIGANALLARVASYYHDIGKIFKPEFFIENQSVGGNKHDKLKPGLSCLIISSHTRDGVDLGREYHLPQRILDIIAEHHGTGKIMFFLQKAQAMAGDRERVDEEYFRYPGPRPSTRESGIVSLADSIEAASRTLASPSPTSLRKIVERIIRNRIDDHQLDETGLTLVELDKIRESFVVVLYGIFHARIEYPDED